MVPFGCPHSTSLSMSLRPRVQMEGTHAAEDGNAPPLSKKVKAKLEKLAKKNFQFGGPGVVNSVLSMVLIGSTPAVGAIAPEAAELGYQQLHSYTLFQKMPYRFSKLLNLEVS